MSRYSKTLAWCLTAAIFAGAARGQGCAGMSYQNRNQIDYGPIPVSVLKGVALDPQEVRVPGVCVGVFSEPEHQLMAFAETDENGFFMISGVAAGKYRLVADLEGFCAANAIVEVKGSRKHGEKPLKLRMRAAGMDDCSHFEK